MRKTILAEIADITLGKPFRTKVDKDPENGNTYLVQIAELNAGFLNYSSRLSKIQNDHNEVRYHLGKGDILMPLRGGNVGAAIFFGDSDMPIITNNQVVRIRLHSYDCTPEFLHWYLNSQLVKSYLLERSQGAVISQLKKQTVESIPIDLPLIEKQHKIGFIHQNWLAQREQYKSLITSGDLAYEALCEKLSR